MREWLLGVVGATALYGAAWVRTVPDGEVAAEPAPASSAVHPPRERVPPPPPERGRAPDAKRASATAAPAPPGGPGAVEPSGAGRSPVAASSDGVPGRADPKQVPPALPASIRNTLQRLGELQQVGADPNRLADRLQKMEVDPAEIQELRQFAERFVDLPPERVNLEEMR